MELFCPRQSGLWNASAKLHREETEGGIPAQHSAIVDQVLFDRVNGILRGHERGRQLRPKQAQDALLKGLLYLCMSSSELHTLCKAFTEAGGHWSTFIIWAKDRFTLGRSDYQRQFEPILYGWREGQEHFWNGSRNQGDVWFVPKPKANRLHATMKPISLIERAIRNSSRRGEVVLDPFGGAGSTMIACEKTGRRAALVELEPRFVDVTIRRWETYTHQVAHLEKDGRTFAAVAQDRLQKAA